MLPYRPCRRKRSNTNLLSGITSGNGRCGVCAHVFQHFLAKKAKFLKWTSSAGIWTSALGINFDVRDCAFEQGRSRSRHSRLRPSALQGSDDGPVTGVRREVDRRVRLRRSIVPMVCRSAARSLRAPSRCYPATPAPLLQPRPCGLGAPETNRPRVPKPRPLRPSHGQVHPMIDTRRQVPASAREPGSA